MFKSFVEELRFAVTEHHAAGTRFVTEIVVWETSGKHLGNIWETSGGIWGASGGIWEASVGIWEGSRRHLGANPSPLGPRCQLEEILGTRNNDRTPTDKFVWGIKWCTRDPFPNQSDLPPYQISQTKWYTPWIPHPGACSSQLCG